MKKRISRLCNFIKSNPIISLSFFILGLSILLMLSAIPVAFWPHYEKEIYEKEVYPENVVEKKINGLDDLRTPPLREEDFENFEEYSKALFDSWSDSSKDIFDDDYSPDYFSFEIDVANLKPTGFYLEGYQFSSPSSGVGGFSKYNRRSGTITTSSSGPPEYTWSWLESLYYRKNSIYTQFYSLELSDGNTVLLQLSDTVMDIPKSGKLKIPVATWSMLVLGDNLNRDTKGSDAETKLADTYNLETDSTGHISYIDASNWWLGYNSELIEMYEQRDEIFIKMLVCGIIGLPISFFIFLFGVSKRNVKKK